MENCTSWLVKMSKYYDEFSSKNSVFLGLASLIFANDLSVDNFEYFTDDEKDFIIEWITFFYKKIAKKDENKKEIQSIYEHLKDCYQKFKKEEEFNLNKYHELYFD